jgi:adenylate cyclase
MITSKDLLARTGVSRATLNNYISMNLLPRPEVKRVSPAPGEAPTTLGYFPDWAITRIEEIRSLKQSGMSIDAIKSKLANQNEPEYPAPSLQDTVSNSVEEKPQTKQTSLAAEAPTTDPQPEVVENKKLELNHLTKEIKESNTLNLERPQSEWQARKPSTSSAVSGSAQQSLSLSIEQIDYPAYMINYESHLVWLNEHAKAALFSDAAIPDRADERSILPALLKWSADLTDEDKAQFFAAHFEQIKHRLSEQAFAKTTLLLSEQDRSLMHRMYAEAQPSENKLLNSYNVQRNQDSYQLMAINFREGVLLVYLPEEQDASALLDWLAQRDTVIRSLLSKRLPVLTPLAVMVADLQNSVRICSELPPEEYFELINQIWSTLNPIFRDYYGAYGKHTGDGMVYYFFPQPDRNHLMNAILCAGKVRDTMKKISHEWAVKKGWTNQLYMNIGLSEGEEWLGTFKTNTNYELVVLGETINIGARLSDFARFGRIWATKNLVSKLSPVERERIEYGIQRKGIDQEVFIENTYAQVGTLHEKDDPRAIKLADITSCAVTEIRTIK